MSTFFSPSLLENPALIVGLFLVAIILAIIIAFYIWRAYVRKNYQIPQEMRSVIMLITVPKESLASKDSDNANSSAKIQEQISWAENLWSSFGAIKAAKGFKAWAYGRYDEISLEIVAENKLIYFYVVAPRYLSQFIEQQIQAQYPHAQIEFQEDYNIFSPNSAVAAATLTLVKPDILPIKTYRKIETDPLNALTNSLSKLEASEGAVIQLLLRPGEKEWHKKGRKAAKEILSGKKIEDVLKRVVKKTWYEKMATSTFKGMGDLHTIMTAGENKDEQSIKNNNTLSPLDQEAVKSIEEKISKASLEINLKVVVSSLTKVAAELNLKNILNVFGQYQIFEYGNGFKVNKRSNITKIVSEVIHRSFDDQATFNLNTEELASIYHFPLPTSSTPNINWLGARKASAPVNMPEEGIILGKNIYRGKEILVRIKKEDRRRHMYIIGMTGTGKSKLMVNMILQDIYNGEGVCYIDPHGEEAELIAANIPKERRDDVIYFDPADVERPMGLNMLEAQTTEEKDFATQEIIEILYKLMPSREMGGPMFEHYMRNAILLLMADKDDQGTFVEIPRVFVDEDFRNHKLSQCSDILVRSFWEKEYTASQRGSTGADMLSYIISKVGRFIENEMMRNIIGQQYSGFNLREIMDNKKILLINLSKGKLGETNSDLLGLMLVSKLQMAAMSRADMPQEKRYDFYLYIDEFQNYVTDSIATILAEARKYRLNLTMAHQYIAQLTKNQNTAVRDAVFGNVGTICPFRIGVEDAEFLVKQFSPVFNEFDLINIEKFNAYIRLMIDNQAARPFNMAALPPAKDNPDFFKKISEYSRLKYGRPREEVEADIMRRSKLGEGMEAETKDRFDMR